MIGCSRPTRQAPRPFAVPSGLHALRSDPDDAGSQVASADAAFLPYAAGATAVRRCFRTGLINEGSHEAHAISHVKEVTRHLWIIQFHRSGTLVAPGGAKAASGGAALQRMAE